MKIFIEGPDWMGRWTEISADALENLGHHCAIHYHNRKTYRAKLNSHINAVMSKLGVGAPCPAWDQLSNQILLEAMSGERWDILLSIQGRIDAGTVAVIRKNNPDVKIIYWLGDILQSAGERRVLEVHGWVDMVAVSYRGVYQRLADQGLSKLYYLPFGISKRFHVKAPISPAESRRFSAEVSFVGTYYPERCELIRYINEQLGFRVRVWGRGWRHCKGVWGGGRLDVEQTLKVYACSKISLNIHHHCTENGFNMKFYEIPAAGGFEICDWQPELDNVQAAAGLVSYRRPDELLEKIRYYLAHDNERLACADRIRQAMDKSEKYEQRFAGLLDALSSMVTGPTGCT